MFHKTFSFAGTLVLAGASILLVPGVGEAQRGGGGHGGGGHFGGGAAHFGSGGAHFGGGARIGGGAIQVKFDEGSVRTYTCRTPSDGMTNVISVWPSRRFVEALKRSHRAIIEAEFTEGEQQLAFNKTGLKW